MIPARLWASLAAVVAVAMLCVWALTSAYQVGRNAERAAILTRSVEILRERNATDEMVKDMDATAICRALGGMSDECDGIGL